MNHYADFMFDCSGLNSVQQLLRHVNKLCQEQIVHKVRGNRLLKHREFRKTFENKTSTNLAQQRVTVKKVLDPPLKTAIAAHLIAQCVIFLLCVVCASAYAYLTQIR